GEGPLGGEGVLGTRPDIPGLPRRIGLCWHGEIRVDLVFEDFHVDGERHGADTGHLERSGFDRRRQRLLPTRARPTGRQERTEAERKPSGGRRWRPPTPLPPP